MEKGDWAEESLNDAPPVWGTSVMENSCVVNIPLREWRAYSDSANSLVLDFGDGAFYIDAVSCNFGQGYL